MVVSLVVRPGTSLDLAQREPDPTPGAPGDRAETEAVFAAQHLRLADLQERQIAILRSALGQLAPGGLLVYSTCSLEREENEDVVAAVDATVVETMQRIPGRDAGDGFFAYLLSAE